MAKSLKKNSLTSRAAPPTAAATAILDAAERLAQTLGYNGFSYADIAAQLGVTKASLHYHFPSKAELGGALIERYRVVFGAALAAIDLSQYKFGIFGIALVVLMLTRPEGIFPSRQRAVEMHGDSDEPLDEQMGEEALIDRPLGGVRA